MATKAPAYQAPDLERLKALRDNFSFDAAREVPNCLVLVAGNEGSGKTHLACSMSEIEPVYLLDTEYRADIVVRKFEGAKHPVKHKVCKTFEDILIATKAIVKYQQPGCLVIDSGSDLQTFAEIEYLKRTKAEKIYPMWNWSEVWALCNAIIDEVRFAQFDVVVTARIKEEYIAEKPSGNYVPRIYSPLPYKADLSIQFPKERNKPGFLLKNGFSGDETIPIQRRVSLPTIIQQLTKQGN